MPGLLMLAALAANAPLAPTSKWGIEYEKDQCVLSRSYGAGTDRSTLAIRPYPMATATEVALLRAKAVPQLISSHAELTLLPARRTLRAIYAQYPVSPLPGNLSTVVFDTNGLADIVTSNAVMLRLGVSDTVTLAIPGIAAAMQALDACEVDLLKQWGIDPAERALVVTPPKPNDKLFSALGRRGYPSTALRAKEEGVAVARADIDATGVVKACVITATSGSTALDETSCEVVTRRGVLFAPGRNRDGMAIPAHAIIPIHWLLPR